MPEFDQMTAYSIGFFFPIHKEQVTMNTKLIQDVIRYIKENEKFLNEIYEYRDYPKIYYKLKKLLKKKKISTPSHLHATESV